MKHLVWWAATMAALAIGTSSCSKSGIESTDLLKTETTFSSPIAVLLPATDDSQLYKNILDGSQQVGGLMVITGCKGYLLQRATVVNFNGPLDVPALVFDNWATVKSINIPGERFDCTIYNPDTQSTAQKLADKFGPAPADTLREGMLYVPIAKRTNINITYRNEYETEEPGSGRTKIIAITCTYSVEIAAGITGLSNSGTGQCQGKWEFDNDTGKWAKIGFSFSDPPFAVIPPTIANDVRTFSVATTSSQGDRVLLEGQVLQCPPIAIQRRFCSFNDKGIFITDIPGPTGTICIDPASGPYRVTPYRGKEAIATDDKGARTATLLTASQKQPVNISYWLAGETCKLPPPSASGTQSTQTSAYFGVTTGTSDSIQIAGIYEGSPAQAAGLQVGDIFTKVQGFQIRTRNDLATIVNSFNPGDQMQVVVNRSGHPLTFNITLGSHSSSFLSNLFANLTGQTRLAPAQAQPVPQPGPSFNCQAARTWGEKQICATNSLFGQDRQVAELYSGKIHSNQLAPQQKVQIRAAQRAWVAEREGCRTHADPVQCLSALYSARLFELAH